MENGVNLEDNKSLKMGATSNQIVDRLALLREKKKTLEETLEKRVKELRELCKKEANLTGTIPREMPLEPGETLPSVRRRVGTAYQLPENLIKNADNDEQTIASLKLSIKVHSQQAEAALGLANDTKLSKTIKRQHAAEYQKHKQKCKELTDQLTSLKEKLAEQMKQKKKTRVPEQDDTVSVNTMIMDPFGNSDLRQSSRSLKQTVSSSDINVDKKYPSGISRNSYRNSDVSYLDAQTLRPDDGLTSGFYGLSLNGYNNYIERRESLNAYYNNQNSVPYNLPVSSQHATHYQQHSPQMLMQQHTPHLQSSHSFQHQRSSQPMYNYNPPAEFNRYSSYISQSASQPQVYRQSSPNTGGNTMKNPYYTSPPYSHSNIRQYQTIDTPYRNPHQIQPHQQYEHNVMTSGLGGCWKSTENGEMIWCNSSPHDSNWDRDKRFGSLDRRKNKRIHKRNSPTVDNKSATLSSVPSYSDHVRIASVKSSHMINRRHDNRQLIRTQSLGSVGAQTIVDSICPSDDNSSCNSDNHSINEMNHAIRKPKEKEWLETSLDGPVSPSHSIASHSQSTLSPHCAMPSPHSSLPSPQNTLPSINPPMPPHLPHHQMPIHPHLHSNVPPPPPPPHNTAPPPNLPSPSILSPDEKYISHHIPPPLTPKPPLEIPAESNRSPRLPETNLELFNNNVPENCTVVQAGYEETKPFEMSDFYKYSTKFKKSPQKAESDSPKPRDPDSNVQKNLLHNFDDKTNNYQPELPMKPLQYRNSSIGSPNNSNEKFFGEMNTWYEEQDNNNSNGSGLKNKSNASNNAIGSPDNSSNSLNLSQLTVADTFSAEMNAWYNSHEHQIDNNNGNGSGPKNRSTATLV